MGSDCWVVLMIKKGKEGQHPYYAKGRRSGMIREGVAHRGEEGELSKRGLT
jgi:hypothetical protein